MTPAESYEDLSRPLRERAAQRSNPERQAQLEAMIQELERVQVQSVLGVGDAAPDFSLREAGSDEEVRLSTALRSGPVVLSFYRGQWCPYCNIEVRALQSIHEEIRALGGEVYLIGPETQENALKLREKTESTLPILFDHDAKVCRLYGLAFELPTFFQEAYRANGNDLPAANPGAGWTLPIPATFVIASDGMLVAKHVDADYTQRMEPAAILEAARQAAATSRAEA